MEMADPDAKTQAALIAHQFRERVNELSEELEAWALRWAGTEAEAAWYFRRAAASLDQARDDLGLALSFLRPRTPRRAAGPSPFTRVPIQGGHHGNS